MNEMVRWSSMMNKNSKGGYSVLLWNSLGETEEIHEQLQSV
jgi:hypothetical protein